MTQWNAVDRERSGWGPGFVLLVAVLFSAEREHSLSDAQDRSAYVLNPYDNACVGKNRQTRKPKHSASTVCSPPRRTTRKEPRHELLDRGARSPRNSREGRSGSVSKRVCGPMGSLSKRSRRRWSLEGLIPVCLSVARCAHAPAPKRKSKVQVDGRSWGLCWQLAEMCSATCWLSAERTSLMGGAWAVPLRSGPCDQLAGN